MSLELATRYTEMLLAFALLQQSAEHMAYAKDRLLFVPRFALSLALLAGIYTPFICAALLLHALCVLHRFQGPYNGGSDRMGLLILCCLCLVYFLPEPRWRETAFGYLALQLVLSYFVAGWVKIINPDWRRGVALADVFRFSAYPVSEQLRALATKPRLMLWLSWAVILLELLFPLSLLSHGTLIIALVLAALFHLANAFLFGLNRFFWAWLAAYPSILWLQARLLGG